MLENRNPNYVFYFSFLIPQKKGQSYYSGMNARSKAEGCVTLVSPQAEAGLISKAKKSNILPCSRRLRREAAIFGSGFFTNFK